MDFALLLVKVGGLVRSLASDCVNYSFQASWTGAGMNHASQQQY